MNLKLLTTIFAIGAVLASDTYAANQTIAVGEFSKASLAGWEQRAFKGETTYAFVYDPAKKLTVLQAVSTAAASGRFRKLVVDKDTVPELVVEGIGSARRH